MTISKARLVAVENEAGEVVVKAVGAARWVVARRSAIVLAVTAAVTYLGTEFPPIADKLTHTQATALGGLFLVAGWIASIPIIQSGTTTAKVGDYPVNANGEFLVPASMSSAHTAAQLGTALQPASNTLDATTVKPGIVNPQPVAAIETGAGGASPLPATIPDVNADRIAADLAAAKAAQPAG